MSFKDANKLFWGQFPIFFVTGLLLLIGFWFGDERTKSFLQESFFEHFAMNSIVLIFLLCLLITGLFLLIFGVANLENKMQQRIYDYAVVPPIELGITLSSVAFSLTASLIAVMLFAGSKSQALGLVIGLGYIVFMAIIYWLMSVVIVDRTMLTEKNERRALGFFLVLSVPVLTYLVVPTLM